MSRFFRSPPSFVRRRPILSSTVLGGASLFTYSLLTSGPSAPLNVDAESLYFSARNALRMEAGPEGTLDRPSTFWTPPSREEMLQKLGAPDARSAREHEGKGGESGLDNEGAKEDKPTTQEDGQSGKGPGQTSEPPNEGEKGGEFDLIIVGGGATGAGVALDAASRGLKVAVVERDDFSSGTSSKSTKLVHGGVRYLQKAVFELDYEQYKLVREALHERKTFLHIAPYLSHSLPIMLPIYTWWQIPYFFA
ncbi:hypothetical protein JCM21900_005773, partial [Sporobolomyces salmonicolor]